MLRNGVPFITLGSRSLRLYKVFSRHDDMSCDFRASFPACACTLSLAVIMDQFPYHHYAANINMNIPLQNYQMQPQEFFPAAFLDLENEPTFPFVLLVLNSPILRGDLYETCASRAMAIIAADGGGNRIFDYVKKTQAPNLMNQLVNTRSQACGCTDHMHRGPRPLSATWTA